jgi:hypothetical protein
VVHRFFRVIKKWDAVSRARLLVFVTGLSRLPVGGFAGLEILMRQRGTVLSAMTINIVAPTGPEMPLPRSHTCFNTNDLPPYRTDDETIACCGWRWTTAVTSGWDDSRDMSVLAIRPNWLLREAGVSRSSPAASRRLLQVTFVGIKDRHAHGGRLTICPVLTAANALDTRVVQPFSPRPE